MSRASAAPQRFPIAAVLLVLAAALGLRVCALWLPHWRGDQAQYVILAMKLSHAGLGGYNLRAVSMGHLDASPSKENRVEFTAVKPAAGDIPGAYLAMMKSIGQSYYDEPLHVRAPLFPAMLALSHKIFVGSTAFGEKTAAPTFAVLSYGPKTFAHAAASWKIWRHQLWAACVPLAFNLALILLTAVLAWVLFGSRPITVAAAAMLAGNPISIWLAHRILTEDAAAFFVTAAVTAFALLWKRSRAWTGLAAGALAGAAVLVNQRTGLILPAVGIFACLCVWQDAPVRNGSNPLSAFISRAIQTVSNIFFWLFGATFLAVTGFWFWRVIQTYGHPLYQPGQAMHDALSSDVTGWFAAVHSRPHPSVLFSIGAILLCPLFAFSLVSWNRSWSSWTGRFRDSQSRGLALLWIWVMTFFLCLANLTDLFGTGNQEHRYFYPAYPALAILSAFGIQRFLQNRRAGGMISALMLVAGAAWGAWLAYPKIFSDQMLF